VLIAAGFPVLGMFDAAKAQLFAYVLEPEGPTYTTATVDVVDLRTHDVTQVHLGGDAFSGTVTPNNALYLVRDHTDADAMNVPLYGLSIVETATRSLRSILPLQSDGGVAAPPDAPVAYVTGCNPAGVLDVLDIASGAMLDEIPLDVNPQNMWLSASGATAYVTDGGQCAGTGLTDDSIAAVDMTAHREIARIPLGGVPRVVAISPHEDRVYATKTAYPARTSVAAIETATNTVMGEIPVDNTGDMAIAPDGARLYVVSYPNDAPPQVSVIDTATLQPAGAVPFQPSDSPAGVAVHPSGSPIYVTYRSEDGQSYLAEVDAATNAITDAIPIPYAGSLTLVNGCAGDCNANGQVTVSEIITSVNVALGLTAVQACPTVDRNGDGRVTVDELVRSVETALDGCGGA
jgi:YVTN family beta-propeller protein